MKINRISVLAVVAGGITDQFFSSILAVPFTIYVMSKYQLLSLPKQAIAEAFRRTVHDNVGLYAMALLTGSLCTASGGYIAARIAKRDAVLNGVLSASFCILVGVYGAVHGSISVLELIAEAPLSLALGGAGAYLGRQSPVELANASNS